MINDNLIKLTDLLFHAIFYITVIVMLISVNINKYHAMFCLN
jgi:hypothetical protein